MPRFQSHLFNWLDRLPPVQLGRQARRALERWRQQPVRESVREAGQALAHLGRLTLRWAAFPLYRVAIAAKQAYPPLASAASPEKTAEPPPLPPYALPFVPLVRWADSRTDLAGLEREVERAIAEVVAFPKTLQARYRAWREELAALESEPDAPHRLRALLQAAIAYFWGERLRQQMLSGDPGVETIKPHHPPWLTMAELFGDDSGPWPPHKLPPAEAGDRHHTVMSIDAYRELYLANEPEMGIQLIQAERSTPPAEASPAVTATSRPLHADNAPRLAPPAWIEAQATFLGYVYSPAMTVVHWLDRWVARCERWCFALWRHLLTTVQAWWQRWTGRA